MPAATDLPARAARSDAGDMSRSTAVCFTSRRLLVGLAIGWFLIRPVNAVLGWFFRGFNRFFDRLTDRVRLGGRQVLRLSVVVLLVYGGLLVLTYWQFATAPDRLHPAAGQGLSDPQRAAAGRRLGGAHADG